MEEKIFRRKKVYRSKENSTNDVCLFNEITFYPSVVALAGEWGENTRKLIRNCNKQRGEFPILRRHRSI